MILLRTHFLSSGGLCSNRNVLKSTNLRRPILWGRPTIKKNLMASVDLYFKRKAVFELECVSCGSLLCRRGMKSVLLADNSTEMFSTDSPLKRAVAAVNAMYMATKCLCKVRDTACMQCGNIVGYQVMHPCKKCLRDHNNGHFWTFLRNAITATHRMHRNGESLMHWKTLGDFSEEEEEETEMECIR